MPTVLALVRGLAASLEARRMMTMTTIVALVALCLLPGTNVVDENL